MMINREKLTPEAVLIILGTVAGTGILPFFVLRLLSNEYFFAFFDLFLSLCCLSVAGYVYKTKKTKVPSRIIVIVCILGELFLINMRGVSLVFWLFPMFLAIYYVMDSKRSFMINTLVWLLVIPKLFTDTGTIEFFSVILTLMVTNIFGYFFADINRRHKKALTKMALCDGLTGINNRRAMDEKLAAELDKGAEITLVILDIDHFKSINDQFGHKVGDDVLVDVANVISKNIRSTDQLFRFGGEEFVVISKSNDFNDMNTFTEKLRKIVEDHSFIDSQHITISIGFAICEVGESVKDLFYRCDKALYRAKNGGRNNVCFSSTMVDMAVNGYQ